MRIRPETPADYAAIAGVHVRAFGQRAGEALIVALHRQRAAFDPALSLVAEAGGRVVGHALFSPRTIRLLGASVRAVNLAPLAVDPAHQGRGIGGRLIEEGHAVARAMGYALCFLLGHATYYPRFGYRTRAYGVSSLMVPAQEPAPGELAARGPTEADLDALRALWLHEEGAIDLAIEPEDELLEWLSPNPAISAEVWTREGAMVGYTRLHTGEATRPHVFLAQDHATARAMVAAIARRAGAAPQLMLPLHPASASAAAFGVPAATAWNAAMVCPLGPSPFDAYYTQVQAEERPPGRPIWPVAFDLG